ncbi:MAG TPA: PH domain-containing protein [Thermoanaerobaculia bacterium]
MAYAEKNLAPGESIVYRARYHWIYYRTTLALLLVAAVSGLWWWISGQRLQSGAASSIFGTIALVLFLIALVHFLLRRIRASADEFVVTTRRVIRKTGLVAREAEHAPIEKIQDISIDQGVIARMLGYGTAVIETASESGRIVFPDIADPEKFRSAIWGQTTGGASAAAITATTVPQPNVASRLAELEDLRTRGLLTTEEYARKRQEIVASP